MVRVPLLLSFFAIALVSMDFALAIVLNKKNRQPWTAWFIVLVSSLLGLTMLFALDQFSSLFYTGTAKFVLHLIWEIFFIADSTFLISFICFFGNWLIARPMAFGEKFLSYAFGSFYLASSILNRIIPNRIWGSLTSLFAIMAIFYVVIIMLVNYKRIENPRVKVISLTLSIVSFAMCPLVISSFLWDSMQPLVIPIIGIAYFIVFLVFLFISLYPPENNSDAQNERKNDGILTLDDVSKYGITARELEVIRLIKQGLTNKEIAAYLSISVNTVNNHIANIFSKTEVRSRIDLLNLLQEASW